MDYYLIAPRKPETERAEERLKKSMALMTKVFGEEDYWAAAMCQEGLSSGTLKEVQLGGMEVQIRMFQDAVTDCLRQSNTR